VTDETLRLVLGTANLAEAEKPDAVLDAFYDAGGRAIDLANVYGEGAAERVVGDWLRTTGRRDDVALYAKGCHPPLCEPQRVSSEVETALGNLGTDRLDAFLLHRDDPRIPVEAWAEALLGELRGGTIEAVGVSNWSLDRFSELRAQLTGSDDDGGPAVFSNHFSLARMAEPPWPGCVAIDSASARALVGSGVTLLAWASLAHGYLSSDAGGGDPSISRHWDTRENRERRRRAAELARELGVTTAAVAIAYVLAHDGIRPVVGTRSVEHLADVLSAERLELPPEQLAQLEAVA
jgi:aryl-alcohol dehydrogenase-like predicted oxidoreductase